MNREALLWVPQKTVRRKLEQGGAALGSTESRQTTRGRDTSLGVICIHRGEAPDNSGGNLKVGYLWATIICARGGFVHSACMLDRAERLAGGHTDSRSCAECRPERPVRTRPPHPAELSCLRIFPDDGRGEDGRRWEVPCSSPSFLRRAPTGWYRPVVRLPVLTTCSSTW